MGYGGGKYDHPTYKDTGDHMEAVEVTFDPRKISYDELLDAYFGGFPTSIAPGPGRVSMALITRGETQRQEATDAKRERERRTGDKVYVDVLADAAFWPAERLHQKFHLQRAYPDLVAELAEAAGGLDAFLDSTAAARLNAFVSGFGGEAALAEAAQELGWDVEALRDRLDKTKR